MTPILLRFNLVSLFLFTGYFALAQNNPLEKRATLQVQKEPLEQVLDTITKQTGVRFSYNSQLIDPKTKVTVNAQNKTVKEILSIILPASVSYKKVGEHIIFYYNLPSDNGKLIDDGLYSVSVAEETTSQQKDTVSLTNEEDMKAQVAALLMTVATASTPIVAQDTMVQKDEIQQQIETAPEDCEPAQITFIYPLGTGWVKSAEKCYHLSINALGGVTGQTKGFAVAGLYNINKYGATGAQFAGIFNVTNADNPEISSVNAQFASIFNSTKQGRSVQFAGIFNHADTASIQGAGIYNIANEANVQIAGIYNTVNETDIQIAGICNTAAQTKCQIAGIANNVQESKCQIAGIVNVTKKGGFQLGLINVRDTADGVSLGLINIVKQGGMMEAGIEAGEFIHTSLTFRSGVQRLYTKISVGYNYTDDFLAVGAGLGTSFNLTEKLGLNLELTHTSLHITKISINEEYWKEFDQFSPLLNYRFAKRFKVYVGPSLNLLIQNENDASDKIVQKVKTPYSMYSKTYKNSTYDMWIGVTGGLKYSIF